MTGTPFSGFGRSKSRYEDEWEHVRKCQQHCQQKSTERIKTGLVGLNKIKLDFDAKMPDSIGRTEC